MVDLNKRHEKANDRQMIILMRLADGKGHSLRELAEYFNKRAKHKMEDNNLKTSVLSGLLEEIEECTLKSLTLEVCDIKEPYSLAIKLRESNDPLAHHIRENGSQDIKRILEETKDISGFNHKSKKLTVLITD